MFSYGFRARSQPGHHITIIDFVRARIDKKHSSLANGRLRRKRNLAPYGDTGFRCQFLGSLANVVIAFSRQNVSGSDFQAWVGVYKLHRKRSCTTGTKVFPLSWRKIPRH
jgi:hypothetical protein